MCSLPPIPGNEGDTEDEFIMGMSDGTLGVVARGDSTARFLPIQKGRTRFSARSFFNGIFALFLFSSNMK